MDQQRFLIQQTGFLQSGKGRFAIALETECTIGGILSQMDMNPKALRSSLGSRLQGFIGKSEGCVQLGP